MISFSCLLRGGDPQKIFTIKIDPSEDVSILKDIIKEKKSFKLANVDASDLILHNVSLPLSDLDAKLHDLGSYPVLFPLTKVSSIFPATKEGHLQFIWVDYPDIQAPVFSSATPLLSVHCNLFDDTRDTIFTVKIEPSDNVSILKKMIKEERAARLAEFANFDAIDLILHNVSLPFADLDQLDSFTLKSYPILSNTTKLSSIFPDISDDQLHVVVDLPPERAPPLRRGLYSIGEESSFISQREDAVVAARKRDSPSTGAKNSTLLATQKEVNVDAIYNGRPISLTAPPIEIFHPIFAEFRRGISQPIDKSSFTAKELRAAFSLVTDSLAFYPNEDARIEEIRTAMRALVDDNILRPTIIKRDNSQVFKPDGCVFIPCEKFPKRDEASVAFDEVKNGCGEGGSDPIHQAQCDYVLYYSAKARQHIRDACCCPAFLLGIAGPFIIISGAIFVDRFISQHLTEYIYLGGTPHFNKRLYEIARVLRTLKVCLGKLKAYYMNLDPPPASALSLSSSGGRKQPKLNPRSFPGTPPRQTQVPSLFPHFRRFRVDGKDFELNYVTRLVPHHSEKAVFKATIQRDGRSHPVVVKFTPTYCARAHEIAYKMGSAPKLWFCEEVESVLLFVVVMDFVEGHTVDDENPCLPPEVLGPLQKTILALHDEDLVHGDLRGPNVVVVDDGNGGQRAILLDFDWGGKEGEVFYPGDINMELTWHEDVAPGTRVRREHDVFMLERWASAERT